MKFLRVLILIMSLVSCSKDESTNSVDDSNNENLVLMPLKLGNHWTFKDIDYNQDGSVKSEIIYTESLLSTININNNTYYVSNLSDYKYINRKTGLWGITYYNNKYSEEGLIYKYPASPNEAFANYDGINTVLSIDKTVTVPAGTFIGCYIFTVAKGPNRVERCFKPNIGQLYNKYIETSSGRVISENLLISYSL